MGPLTALFVWKSLQHIETLRGSVAMMSDAAQLRSCCDLQELIQEHKRCSARICSYLK